MFPIFLFFGRTFAKFVFCSLNVWENSLVCVCLSLNHEFNFVNECHTIQIFLFLLLIAMINCIFGGIFLSSKLSNLLAWRFKYSHLLLVFLSVLSFHVCSIWDAAPFWFLISVIYVALFSSLINLRDCPILLFSKNQIFTLIIVHLTHLFQIFSN